MLACVCGCHHRDATGKMSKRLPKARFINSHIEIPLP